MNKETKCKICDKEIKKVKGDVHVMRDLVIKSGWYHVKCLTKELKFQLELI